MSFDVQVRFLSSLPLDSNTAHDYSSDMATDYKKGEFVSNKHIPGSVYIVDTTDVLGGDPGGGTNYLIKPLHNSGRPVVVSNHSLNYYYKRLSKEDIPFVLLAGLDER